MVTVYVVLGIKPIALSMLCGHFVNRVPVSLPPSPSSATPTLWGFFLLSFFFSFFFLRQGLLVQADLEFKDLLPLPLGCQDLQARATLPNVQCHLKPGLCDPKHRVHIMEAPSSQSSDISFLLSGSVRARPQTPGLLFLSRCAFRSWLPSVKCSLRGFSPCASKPSFCGPPTSLPWKKSSTPH